MFPVPESTWMGAFAVHVANSYQIGASRGDRSLLSAMDVEREEFFAFFGRTITDLIINHRDDLERKRKWSRSESEPKTRWADQTPEYSVYIYGLRKLFQEAVFIHVLRDVRAVVCSMLNFHRVAGTQAVANEEKACKCWLGTVRACIKAEEAYGPRVVYRVRYTVLVNNPESAMRSLLDFLGEPYCAKCLEPLAERMNSSNVPADFKADDPTTDPTVMEKATRLSVNVSEAPRPDRPSREAANEMEAAFRERVDYTAGIHRAYKRTRKIIKALNYSRLPLFAVTQAALAIDESLYCCLIAVVITT